MVINSGLAVKFRSVSCVNHHIKGLHIPSSGPQAHVLGPLTQYDHSGSCDKKFKIFWPGKKNLTQEKPFLSYGKCNR